MADEHLRSSRQLHGVDDSPVALEERLHRATGLPDYLLELAAAGKPPSIAGDDLPEATLLQMTFWAAVEFRGLLRLLNDPRSAFSAEVLVRALAEYFAQVLWIATGIPGAESKTARCRALCLELGVAVQADKNAGQAVLTGGVRTTDASSTYLARVRASATQRLDEVRSLHASEGCTCAGRNWRGVGETVWGLREQHGISWAQEVWSVTSAAAHQLLSARLVRDQGDGTSIVLDEAPWQWRSDLLDLGVGCFGIAGLAMLRSVNPEHAPELATTLSAFLGPLYPPDAGDRQTSPATSD